MKIGYLGPEGSQTQLAAEKFSSKLPSAAELTPLPGLAQVMAAIAHNELDYAVLPAENSIEGSINATWDWLVFRTDLPVVGELTLPVRHFLVGHRAQKISAIRTVLSHPQALAQCREYLRTMLPQAIEYETVSTAEAARVVSVNRLPIAAIAGEQAAARYGLDILAADIQDIKENTTRFVIVGRKPLELALSRLNYKTSLVCMVERDQPGSLHDILEIFAAKQINLTRIESRPARKNLGDYIFLIDTEKGLDSPAIIAALHELHERNNLLKVLGSYPVLD